MSKDATKQLQDIFDQIGNTLNKTSKEKEYLMVAKATAHAQQMINHYEILSAIFSKKTFQQCFKKEETIDNCIEVIKKNMMRDNKIIDNYDITYRLITIVKSESNEDCLNKLMKMKYIKDNLK